MVEKDEREIKDIEAEIELNTELHPDDLED